MLLHSYYFSHATDYEIIATGFAVNELVDYLTPDIEAIMIGANIPGFDESIEVPGIDDAGIQTTNAQITKLSIGNMTVYFDDDDQLIYLTMFDVTGHLSAMDIKVGATLKVPVVGKEKLYCNGYATPTFKHWNMEFAVDIQLVNDSCAFELDMNKHSIQIEDDVLNLHDHWDEADCDLVIDALDAIGILDELVSEEIVNLMPKMIVDLLDDEMQKILPKTQDVNLAKLGVEESVSVCYENVSIIGDSMEIGVSMEFGNDSFSDLPQKKHMLEEVELLASNLSEVTFLCIFGPISILCGCAFRYWLWRRRKRQQDAIIILSPDNDLYEPVYNKAVGANLGW